MNGLLEAGKAASLPDAGLRNDPDKLIGCLPAVRGGQWARKYLCISTYSRLETIFCATGSQP